MLEFFKILRFSPTAPDIPLTYTMNILEHWEGVTERDVALHVEFLQHYGQTWDVQNLDLPLELMENS